MTFTLFASSLVCCSCALGGRCNAQKKREIE